MIYMELLYIRDRVDSMDITLATAVASNPQTPGTNATTKAPPNSAVSKVLLKRKPTSYSTKPEMQSPRSRQVAHNRKKEMDLKISYLNL